jgi:hypothetical protein
MVRRTQRVSITKIKSLILFRTAIALYSRLIRNPQIHCVDNVKIYLMLKQVAVSFNEICFKRTVPSFDVIRNTAYYEVRPVFQIILNITPRTHNIKYILNRELRL